MPCFIVAVTVGVVAVAVCVIGVCGQQRCLVLCSLLELSFFAVCVRGGGDGGR